jgi:hypothetical protein
MFGVAATIPLRFDSALVNEARSLSVLMDRSVTAQVESWAKLGRVAEAVFAHDRIRLLKEMGRVQDLDTLLAKVDTLEGRELAKAEIERYGTPMYGTDPAHPGLIVQKLPGGTKRLGRFINRQFVVMEETAAR